MKRVLLVLFCIAFVSCKKEKVNCYTCVTEYNKKISLWSFGSTYKYVLCDMTEGEIDKYQIDSTKSWSIDDTLFTSKTVCDIETGK